MTRALSQAPSKDGGSPEQRRRSSMNPPIWPTVSELQGVSFLPFFNAIDTSMWTKLDLLPVPARITPVFSEPHGMPSPTPYLYARVEHADPTACVQTNTFPRERRTVGTNIDRRPSYEGVHWKVVIAKSMVFQF
ncbi:MAG: hypothetical protein WA924_02835 [Burkholderiaceae bacterium]